MTIKAIILKAVPVQVPSDVLPPLNVMLKGRLNASKPRSFSLITCTVEGLADMSEVDFIF